MTKTKPAKGKTKGSAKPAAEKKTSAKKDDTSQIAKAKGLIKEAGKTGISAEKLGTKLGILKKSMEGADRTAALKKVRVLARKATDGAATKRDGRTAVYVL